MRCGWARWLNVGGLDASHDWEKLLSTGGNSAVAFARVLLPPASSSWTKPRALDSADRGSAV